PTVLVIPPDSPKLRQIQVETVSSLEFPVSEVDASGQIELNPERVSRVVLPLPGRIAEVLVKMGDSVGRGQPLLTLESPDAEAAASAHLQSEASLTQSKAALAKAQ